MTAEDKAVEVSLPTDTEILISRWFRTPTEVIYRAWTTPYLVRRWWGGQRGLRASTWISGSAAAGGTCW